VGKWEDFLWELLPAPPKGSSVPPKTFLIPALPFTVKDKD